MSITIAGDPNNWVPRSDYDFLKDRLTTCEQSCGSFAKEATRREAENERLSQNIAELEYQNDELRGVSVALDKADAENERLAKIVKDHCQPPTTALAMAYAENERLLALLKRSWNTPAFLEPGLESEVRAIIGFPAGSVSNSSVP